MKAETVLSVINALSDSEKERLYSMLEHPKKKRGKRTRAEELREYYYQKLMNR